MRPLCILIHVIVLLLLISCGKKTKYVDQPIESSCEVIDTGTHFNIECNDGTSDIIEYPNDSPQNELPTEIDADKCKKFAPKRFKEMSGKSLVCWIDHKNNKMLFYWRE